jgi:drug/metabolite transporter (DMT)-like permease
VTLSSAVKSPSVDKLGWIALLIGTGIIAWSGVLVRFLDVGPLAGAAWRMGLAVPALAVWARCVSARPMSPAEPAAFAFSLILAGLAFAADVGFFHIALTGTKVANASFIGNMAPILTVIGGALFFTEHPPPRVWFALALALFGSWVMAGMVAPLKLGFGDICALCASIAYAAYLLVIKRVLAIAALARGEILAPRSALGWTVVVLLGVVSHAMGQGLTSVAIGRVPVGLVALVLLAQPPFSALLAWRVIGETMTPLQMAGGAVILAAVFLARPK